MPQTLRKIDNQGNYTKFPGVTIISAIKKEDYDFWEKLYNSLNKDKLLKQYFSPLPYQSFHMTAFNLFTEKGIGADNWKTFLRERSSFFQLLCESLKKDEFSPKITIQDVEVSGIILLKVSLPRAQEELISLIGRNNGVEDKIPSFHISLAYSYKEIKMAEAADITQEIKEGIIKFIKPYNLTFPLESPKLCYFNDMTGFIPWAGTEFPFEQ